MLRGSNKFSQSSLKRGNPLHEKKISSLVSKGWAATGSREEEKKQRPRGHRAQAHSKPPPVLGARPTPSAHICAGALRGRTFPFLPLPPLPSSPERSLPPPPTAGGQTFCAGAVPPPRLRTNRKRQRRGAWDLTPWAGPGREGSALASQGRLYK